ncbi:hypothetical protein ACJIZ3_010086 [Penstemon smallii]|uniref:Ubiquitin-like protease family profile domain-containing protein n=1 Tax=Penstemon smallii TaxID=265156 RepID=A0ABD3TF85_9LAMI
MNSSTASTSGKPPESGHIETNARMIESVFGNEQASRPIHEEQDNCQHDSNGEDKHDQGVEARGDSLNNVSRNVDEEAVHQLIFENIDDAEIFYTSYANLAGFQVRKASTKCKKGGELVKNKEWVCTRQGFRQPQKMGYGRKPKPETRCGCKASFRVAHDRFSGHYNVTRFESRHNHPLQTSTKRYMSSSDKSMLSLMTDYGYRPSQVMDFMEQLAGGAGKLSFTRKDGYNWLNKIRLERIQGGDVNTAHINKESKKLSFLPSNETLNQVIKLAEGVKEKSVIHNKLGIEDYASNVEVDTQASYRDVQDPPTGTEAGKVCGDNANQTGDLKRKISYIEPTHDGSNLESVRFETKSPHAHTQSLSISKKPRGEIPTKSFTKKGTHESLVNRAHEGEGLMDFVFDNKSGNATSTKSHVENPFAMYDEWRIKQCHELLEQTVVKKFEHRTSLRKLLEINNVLDNHQISAIEDLGFGSFTKLQFDQVDKVMVRWIIDRYEPDTNNLTIHMNSFNVDDAAFYHTLGIPTSTQNITLDDTSSQGLDKYKHMFSVTRGGIDTADLAERLKKCKGCGDEFKVMYMFFLFGTVLFPGCYQNLPTHYLNLLINLDYIKELNWAGFVREKLNEGVRLWKNNSQTYVRGCLFFFQVFFLAIIRPRGSPHYINPSFELPFVNYLTRRRVSLLTSDMQKYGGYLNAEACFTTETTENYPTDTTPVHQDGAEGDNVNEGKNMSNIDANLVLLVGEKTKLAGQGNNMRRVWKNDTNCHPNNVEPTLINKTVSSNDFSTQHQLDLLTARVMGMERQVTQLMNTMNDLLHRRSEDCVKEIGHIATIIPQLQESFLEIQSTSMLNETIPRATTQNLEQSARISEPKFCSGPILNNVHPSLAGKGDYQRATFLRTPKSDRWHSPLPDFQPHHLRCDQTNTKDAVEKITIDISSSDNQLKSGLDDKIGPFNPMADEDAIIEYLFDEDKDMSECVVDFGNWRCNRSNMISLKPATYINGSVIDCVAYNCTLVYREENMYQDRWYFPAMFSQLCLIEHYSDEKIIKTFFDGPQSFTSDLERCRQMYIPINDLHEHWFLVVIDLELKTISICDSTPVDALEEYRKRIVNKVVQRVERLLKIWARDKFKVKSIINEFVYENPAWVPKQNNGYDCGLYVCLMMMLDLRNQRQLLKDASTVARRRIAIQLYRSRYNRFSWTS